MYPTYVLQLALLSSFECPRAQYRHISYRHCNTSETVHHVYPPSKDPLRASPLFEEYISFRLAN